MRVGKIFLWLLLLPAMNLAAASSFSALAGMGYLSDFAGGSTTSFPSSARIQQGVNDLGWFDNVDTSMFMDINFGLTERRVVQDPVTGAYLDGSEMTKSMYYYSSFYSGISYIFRNSLIYNHRTDRNLLTLDAGINVRFEQAFDSLSNIRSGKTFLEGYLPEGEKYWDAQSRNYIALPDINGSAYLLANSISFSAAFDNMYQEKNKIYREGISGNASITLAPWFLANKLPKFFDTKVDYYKLAADVTYAKVIYNKEDWKRWNRLSLVIEDRLYAQLLLGDAVPKLADTISFPGLGYTNLPFVIQNQFKFYVYGPNFLSDNTIPYGYLFIDLGLASGRPSNSNSNVEWENFLYMEIGVNLHFELLGALHVFGEVSYTLSNIVNYGNFFDWNIGAYFSI